MITDISDDIDVGDFLDIGKVLNLILLLIAYENVAGF